MQLKVFPPKRTTDTANHNNGGKGAFEIIDLYIIVLSFLQLWVISE